MEHGDHEANLELLDTDRGLWVIKVTFFTLVATAAMQGVITVISGSTALFADTIHGLGNAFTTLPLWVAFALGRKKPTKQFPYGYQRAEDVAGILILLFIAAIGALVGYESFVKLLDPEEPTNLPWAMGAGVVGFLVNEGIAQYRVKVGIRDRQRGPGRRRASRAGRWPRLPGGSGGTSGGHSGVPHSGPTGRPGDYRPDRLPFGKRGRPHGDVTGDGPDRTPHHPPDRGHSLNRYFPDGIQCFHKHTILRQSRL